MADLRCLGYGLAVVHSWTSAAMHAWKAISARGRGQSSLIRCVQTFLQQVVVNLDSLVNLFVECHKLLYKVIENA